MSFFLIESDQYPYVYFGGGGKDTPFKIVGDNGVLNPSATFTRASQGTTEITQGVFTQAAVNESRYQWSGGKRGLLIEQSSTNLVFPSVTAQTMTVVVTAQAYTLSFFGAGSVTLSGASTGVVAGAGTTLKTFTFTPTAGNLTLTVTAPVTQWQLETGNKATSRIITTSAAATRAADLITISKENISFNSAEGTFICEYIADSNTTSIVVQADVGGSEFVTRRDAGSHGTWNGVLECNTTNQVTGQSKIKVGTIYWNGGIGVAMNGAGYNSINSTYSLSSATMIKIGPVSTPSLIFNLPYYPRKFTQAELQAATT